MNDERDTASCVTTKAGTACRAPTEASRTWREQLPPLTLLLGDCREILPQLPAGAVDLVLTDPPYGKNYQSQRVPKARRFKAVEGDASRGVASELTANVLFKITRVIRESGHCYVFSDSTLWPLLLDKFPPDLLLRNVLCYLKGRSTGDLHSHSYTPGWETILFLVKGEARKLNGHPADVLMARRPSGKGRIHPMQKAVDVCERLIENSTQPGEIVLDPFAGSGTTGVAAMLCDTGPRKAILIEKDPAVYEKALKRLRCLGPVETEI